MSDQSLLRSGAALVAGATGLVWVEGPDAHGFLDSLLSQNVGALSVGGGARSLLLAPNGKLRANLYVLRHQDKIGLMTDRATTELVAGDLARFKIRVNAEIGIEDRPVWDVWGPDARASLLPIPEDRAWAGDDPLVARFPFRSSKLLRYVVVGEAPDLPLAEPAAVRAVRIEVGEPIVGVDLDDRTIPQEVGDVGAAVDFTKGCYLGQELVARIDSRGHVNRRLAGVIFGGTDVPPAGAEVSLAGAPVGSITVSNGKAGMTNVDKRENIKDPCSPFLIST